jgi:cytoskeletal protein RodZ
MAKIWAIGILIGIIGIVIFLNKSNSPATSTTPVPTTESPSPTPTSQQKESSTSSPSSSPSSPTSPTSGVKMKIIDYITELDNATTALTKASSKINTAYGLKNGFYISGQAVPPSTGITKIGPDVIKATTNECTLNVPNGTTLFIYNPLTMTCSYYSGNVNLSSLQTEPIGVNSKNQTIGSLKL